MDEKSPIKYIINETKYYGTSDLKTTKLGEKQMSKEWLFGEKSHNNRLKYAAEKYGFDYDDLENAYKKGQIECILSKVDESGKVTIYKLYEKAEIVGEWP